MTRNPSPTGDCNASRQAKLLDLCYVALKAAEEYMERQYDGYYCELNRSDRSKVEHAIGQLSQWKLDRMSQQYENPE